MRVEVDAPTVESAFESVITEFQRDARLPGFRQGKVPRERLAKAFAKEIEQEARKRLLGDTFRKALKEQKLHVVGRPDIEEIQFARGTPLQYAATMETAPDFELPEYKGVRVKVPNRVVTQGDLEKALIVLREQKATYHDVTRPAANGDFVVINYQGSCEGKSIMELAPTARSLTEHKNYWLRLEAGSFLPGFAEQLIGVAPGDQRTVTIDFPPNFMEASLAGKKGVYQVEVLHVKERHLPELNEEFAKSYGAESLEKLREGVRADLQKELHLKQSSSIRQQIMRTLLDRITCELPESVVQAETKNVVYDLVRENQKRGVPKEAIDGQKDQIYSYANNQAKERVKIAFLVGRIAAKENIQASEEEVGNRILQLAQQYQMKPEKLVKQLKERDGLAEIEEQIISAKVKDFLQLHAQIEEDATIPALE
jgi:trigger factor